VRGCTVPLSFLFLTAKENLGIIASIEIVAAASFVIAFLGLRTIRESFGISLNYLETKDGQFENREPNRSGKVEEKQELAKASGY
jgi:hypothetical protein